jgi:hypothetical protein
MVAAVVLASAGADAAVLCQQKKSGHLLIRPAACKKAELAVDLTQFLGAGTAVGSVTLEGSTGATTPTVLDSFTIQAPGPGSLLVTVSGMIQVNADATTSAAVTVPARLGLCDTSASDSQCDGTYAQVYHQDADDEDTLDTTPSFTLTRTVSVAAAGPRVFYVNGEAPPSPPGATLSLWVDPIVGAGPVASATFVPAPLQVTSP